MSKSTKTRKPVATLSKEISALKATATRSRKAAGKAVKAGNSGKAASANAKSKAASAKATALNEARKPTQTQSPKGMVPGYPRTKLVTNAEAVGGKAMGGTIAAVMTANRGMDSIAVTNDGGMYPVTKFLGMGVKVERGMLFTAVADEYRRAVAADQTARNAKPKGPAVLAKGAETEVHSRKAAADSRKPAKVEKPAKPAKGAKKASKLAAGEPRKYKAGSKKDESRDGTFRRYMLTTILAHKDTAAANAAHAKSHQFASNKLDFNWSAAQGYIVWVA